MFKTGIVSVTFRKLSIDEILRLCVQNHLPCIEVGSDVHAPKEKLAECRRIAELANTLGVEIVSYGTYYKLGQLPCGEAKEELRAYIAAAKTLGTRNLRLWAGTKNRELCTFAEIADLVGEAKYCAKAAAAEGMTVSFEFHGGTLTNTPEGALALIESLDEPNASLYWQPNQSKDVDFNCEGLKLVLPYVSSVHTFAWDARSGPCIRYPLAEHESDWSRYLELLASSGREHTLLLEFVKDDSVEQLVSDAAAVNAWSRG